MEEKLDAIESFKKGRRKVRKRKFQEISETISVTSRIMSRKLLMFAKLSLKSSIYELSETMCFPDETVLSISENTA